MPEQAASNIATGTPDPTKADVVGPRRRVAGCAECNERRFALRCACSYREPLLPGRSDNRALPSDTVWGRTGIRGTRTGNGIALLLTDMSFLRRKMAGVAIVSLLRVKTLRRVTLAYVAAIVIAACGYHAPAGERNWRLLWQDGSRNYYVDTSTVHVVSDSVEAIAWDIRRLASGSQSRFGLPRVESTREDIHIRCSTRVMSGVSTTSTSSLREIGGQSVSVFAGSANVDPHLALERFLCK